jgi:hypothetical protein
MRYLRMLSNAILAGLLGAAYLAVLVLQLNPQVPIASATAAHWFATLVAFYGLYLTVAVYAVIVLREVLASRPLAPAWISVRLLAWLGAAIAGAAAWITWANLKGFRAVLTDPAAEQLRQGAVATTVFAVVLALVAVLRYSVGRRGTPATAAVLFVSMAMSVAVPSGCAAGELAAPRGRRYRGRAASARRSAAPGPHVASLPSTARASGSSARGWRRAAAEFRHAARARIRNRSRDAETDAGAAGVGPRPPENPPKNGVVRTPSTAFAPRTSDPVDLLPDYCFSAA